MEMWFSIDDSNYANFLEIDEVGELVTITPQQEDKAGTYN